MFASMDAFKTSMHQAKRQCKGYIKNEYQCCKNIRTDIENAERLTGNGTPNIYAERGEGGNIGAIRSRQK